MAQFLFKEKGIRTAVCVFDIKNKAYTKGWFENFKVEFEALGGSIIGEVSFESGPDIHFNALAKVALEKKPDAVILVTGAMDAAMMAQQIELTGEDITVATCEWAATEQLLKLGGASVEGVFVSQFFDRDSKAASYEKFSNDFVARFASQPGFASVGGYDAATVVMDALEARTESEHLKDTIKRVSTFTGVQGAIVIDPMGESDRITHLSVVNNGAFISVE
jgi:branched-chain amino acid transport system substrate-binding protein